MATISLVIPTDDLAEESKEEFELKISSVSDNRVVIGPEDVATVTVEDGDSEWEGCVAEGFVYGESLVPCQLMLPWQFISPLLGPTVNFQPITYTVSEGEEVHLVLILDKEPATTFMVEFMTEDVTANCE